MLVRVYCLQSIWLFLFATQPYSCLCHPLFACANPDTLVVILAGSHHSKENAEWEHTYCFRPSFDPHLFCDRRSQQSISDTQIMMMGQFPRSTPAPVVSKSLQFLHLSLMRIDGLRSPRKITIAAVSLGNLRHLDSSPQSGASDWLETPDVWNNGSSFPTCPIVVDHG